MTLRAMPWRGPRCEYRTRDREMLITIPVQCHPLVPAWAREPHPVEMAVYGCHQRLQTPHPQQEWYGVLDNLALDPHDL